MTEAEEPKRFQERLVHVNFATRMLIGGLALSLSIILVVSAFLLISRATQTKQAAQSNSLNRAHVLSNMVDTITAEQARFAAGNLAGLRAVKDALTSADPTTFGQLFDKTSPSYIAVQLHGVDIVVFDKEGRVLVSSADGSGGAVVTKGPSGTKLTSQLATVTAALHKNTTVEGVENLGGNQLVDDFAAPVTDANNSVTGVVVYSAPVANWLTQLAPAVGYTTAYFVPGGNQIVRIPFDQNKPKETAVSPPQTGSLPQLQELPTTTGPADLGSIYTADGVEVAGSFVAINDPNGHPAVYVGVEAPTSLFVGDQTRDELLLLFLAATTAGVVVVLVLLFVNRFVRKPVAQLGEGVARIAGGDYSSDIPVDSHDELGTLADRVNVMRVQIASYIRHVDGSVARLGEVSRALTTTTTGFETLERAVCTAAAAITGEGSEAAILNRDGSGFVVRPGSDWTPPPLGDGTVLRVTGGSTARIEADGHHAVVIPMFYQQEVTGALFVQSPDRTGDADERALMALANNADIAIETTRLYEQEKDTVRRLRELDAMKSDFLSTAQHELRTPVTAIMGELDLLRLAWGQWDDAAKLDILSDIEVSTRMMGELLETIIDFSLVSAEHLKLHIETVDVAAIVDLAVDDVRHHYKDGLPVTLDVQVTPDLAVTADQSRFRQVIRCLLDNAVKFSDPDKKVHLRATIATDPNFCSIEVSDEGIGIPAEALPRIFERFFQVDNSNTRHVGGMGMGLALVSELSRAHGATIAVTSAEGKGSQFTIRWPRAIKPPAGEKAPPNADGFHLIAGR